MADCGPWRVVWGREEGEGKGERRGRGGIDCCSNAGAGEDFAFAVEDDDAVVAGDVAF